MRKIIVFLLFFVFLQGGVHAVQIIDVNKDGRAIQLDGFLLDWKKTDAQVFSKDSLWHFDVLNTREGIAGYFEYATTNACSSFVVKFLPCNLSPYKGIVLNTDSLGQESICKVSQDNYQTNNVLVCEWIIPWDKVCRDSLGKYQVGLFIHTNCGDSLAPAILTGAYKETKTNTWGGVFVKSVVLGGLLVFLYIFQRKTRKMKRRSKVKKGM